jgi:hypothetical protein
MGSIPLKFDHAMADTLAWAMPLDDAAQAAMAWSCHSVSLRRPLQ